MIRIPPDALSQDALRGLVEEYVTRDGTDYGEREIDLEARVQQVKAALALGKAVIVYDGEGQGCHILPVEQAPPE